MMLYSRHAGAATKSGLLFTAARPHSNQHGHYAHQHGKPNFCDPGNGNEKKHINIWPTGSVGYLVIRRRTRFLKLILREVATKDRGTGNISGENKKIAFQ
jgi:hypothetical protein